MSDTPETVWRWKGLAGHPPRFSDTASTGTGTEYVRKDLGDAQIKDLEDNINTKADWIEATINDMACHEEDVEKAYNEGIETAAAFMDIQDSGYGKAAGYGDKIRKLKR